MERAGSQPSARTMGPKEAMDWGTKLKDGAAAEAVPVSRRIKYWWDGGPWNHHSRSGATIWCTVATSWALRASYRARTSP